MTQTAAELEQEVEASRDNLDRTVEALKDKMSPGQLFDEASRAFGGAGQQVLSKFVEQAKENPMPLAVMGLGLAWLMSSSGKARRDMTDSYGGYAAGIPPETRSFAPSSSDGHGIGETVKAVGEKAGETMEGAKEGLSSAASSMSRARHDAQHSLKSAAGGTMDRAGSMARQATSGFSDMLEREPLLIGALGVIVGIAVGAALPSTEAEDKLVGPVRDHLMEKGADIAQQGMQQATQAAQAAYGAVKEGLAEGAEGGDAAEKAATVARDAVQAAKDSLNPSTPSSTSTF